MPAKSLGPKVERDGGMVGNIVVVVVDNEDSIAFGIVYGVRVPELNR